MDLFDFGAWTPRCAFKKLEELIEKDLMNQFAILHVTQQNRSLPVQGLMASPRFTSRILISKQCLSQINSFLLFLFFLLLLTLE